jgi:hypothetical protein
MPILSEEALRTARHAIRVELVTRQRHFPAQLRRHGTTVPSRRILSSRGIQLIRKQIKAEYDARAATVWGILKRLISAEQLPPSAGLARLAKAELIQALDSHCNDLVQVDEQALRQTRVDHQWPDHYSLKEEAIARTEAEIDIELLSTRRPASPAHSTTVNIINPVGVVQTGPGASATLHQHFGSTQREVLQEALLEVRQAVGTAQEIPADLRDEILAVVADADKEVRARSPNVLRLRGTLSAIASTIQTLGSTAAAYQLLKAAALHVGVQLP